jgi:hypothetical protein
MEDIDIKSTIELEPSHYRLTDPPAETTNALSGQKRVYKKHYVPDAGDWEYIAFMPNTQAIESFGGNSGFGAVRTPATVGELTYRYATLLASAESARKQLLALEDGLAGINLEMNEYAETANFCNEYEQKLKIFNQALRDAGYTGTFEFVGRMYDGRALVRRHRVIIEEVWVNVTMDRNGELFDEEDATSIAEDLNPEDFDIVDEQYDTSDYEIMETEVL